MSAKGRARERIALVVLVVLVALAGFAIISYFFFGRSLNIAATLMDDAVGRMNGYTALVIHTEQGTDQGGGSVLPVDSEASTEQDALEKAQSGVPAEADTMGLRIMAYYAIANPNGIKAVDPQAVIDLYKEKDTNVGLLEVSEYGIGTEPEVIEVGSKKIGIFYAVGYKSDIQIGKICSRLREKGAEAIMCITPRLATLQSTAGINAVLVMDVDDEIASGNMRNGETLITTLPSSGKVEVVLFSSNNVATARVIDAL